MSEHVDYKQVLVNRLHGIGFLSILFFFFSFLGCNDSLWTPRLRRCLLDGGVLFDSCIYFRLHWPLGRAYSEFFSWRMNMMFF